MRPQDIGFIKIMVAMILGIALWHTIETNCLVPPLATIPF
jgi:hypothetical protein